MIDLHTRPAVPGLALTALCLAAAPTLGQQEVFFSNFNAALPAQIAPGVAQLTGVQGYAGLGTPGNQFGGSFLRSPTGNLVSLTLTDLPPHSTVTVGFLFAAIDSLDGTGNFPEGDFLRVRVDGVVIFRESFANATASQDQTYTAPAGGQLARRVDLGFTGPGSFYTDSAYNMYVDPRFINIPHTASTLTIDWLMEGPGIQSLSDESWAMDNLKVTITPLPACGSADFNNDGDTGTDADIEAFFSCLAGNCCAACQTADFNLDGDVGTDADIEAFFRVLAGGAC